MTWVEGDGPRYAGKLELGRRELRLEAGTNGGGTGVIVREIAYSDLSEVSVGRTGKDRIGDRPALVLERRFGDPIRIASVVQAGIVSELAERLAAVLLAAPTRVVVVLPLRAGARARVRALLAEGPPFDPEAAGLDRHQVFLSDREAVFLFEAASPSVIAAARGNRRSLGGSRRLAGLRGRPRAACRGCLVLDATLRAEGRRGRRRGTRDRRTRARTRGLSERIGGTLETNPMRTC